MNLFAFDQARAAWPRLTLAAVLPVALGLIEAGDRDGVDVGPCLRPLLVALAAAEGVSLPGVTLDELAYPSRGEQIEALYVELAGPWSQTRPWGQRRGQRAIGYETGRAIEYETGRAIEYET